MRKKKFEVGLDTYHRELIDNAGERLGITSSEVIRRLIEQFTFQYVQEQTQMLKKSNEQLLMIKENTSIYAE